MRPCNNFDFLSGMLKKILECHALSKKDETFFFLPDFWYQPNVIVVIYHILVVLASSVGVVYHSTIQFVLGGSRIKLLLLRHQLSSRSRSLA